MAFESEEACMPFPSDREVRSQQTQRRVSVAIVFMACLLGLTDADASASPFTPFEVIAPSEIEISYAMFSCECGALQLGLIAATSGPVDLDLITFGVRSLTEGFSLPSGGFHGWAGGADNVLSPGSVSSVYPVPDPAFADGLLPGEHIVDPLGTPAAPTGAGMRVFFGFPEDFEGDVGLEVWVDWREPGSFPPFSRATYSILGHIHRVDTPPIPDSPGSAAARVVSTQRISAVPVPEPSVSVMLGASIAALFARRRRRVASR
jgi:hypothetical protein